MSRISVHLRRRAYRPGETVEGEVRWDSAGETPELVRISLLWFTEGKGSEDSATLVQREIEQPAAAGSERFSLRLPAFPWSFSGTLISLVWAVEASLDPEGAVALETLVSAPNGEEARL